MPNRPSPGTRRPDRATMPSTKDTVNSTSATTPLPRPNAHHAELRAALLMTAPLGVCSCRVLHWPVDDSHDAALLVDETGGEAAIGEPPRRLTAQHDGCGGGGVRLDIRARGDGHAAPDRRCRSGRAWVDDVVEPHAAAAPGTPYGRGGGDRGPRGEGHLAGRVVLGVADEHLPAAGRRGPGGGDVAADLHEDADPLGVRCPTCQHIG